MVSRKETSLRYEKLAFEIKIGKENTPFGSICPSNDLVPSLKVLVFETHWYHRIYCDLDFDSSNYTFKLMIILFKISIIELNLNVRVINKFVEIGIRTLDRIKWIESKRSNSTLKCSIRLG